MQGVFPPIPTPFDRDEIDLAGLRSNIERWMRTDLDGIVVLGSNGEAPYLDEDESDRVVAAAREYVPSDRLLIAGTGRESTRATVSATCRAADLGADAVLVRTPSFFKSRMTNEALVRHYTAVADESPVPLVLYNFTDVTGVNLQPAAVARLSEHRNIAGVKDANGDIAQVAELVSSTPASFHVLVGSAQTFYASLCVGAVGGILALACVVPELCVRLYRLLKDGRHADALALQRRLMPLARSIGSLYGVPGLKAAMDLAGYCGGDPRPPLAPPPPVAVEEIGSQLTALEDLSP